MKTSNFVSFCIWSLLILCGYSLPPKEHIDLRPSTSKLYSDPEILGSGTFAVVYKVNVNGSNFALKVAKKDSSPATRSLRKEVGILNFLQKHLHDDERPFFVLPPVGIQHFVHVSLKHSSMPMELNGILLPLYENGDLSEYLKSPGEKDWREVTALALDIAHSLDALKKVNVIHMDIKPRNILLSRSEFRLTASLADFGGSAILNRSTKTFSSTQGYRAPGRFVLAALNSATDVFAFGSVLLQLTHRRQYCPADLEYLQGLMHSEPDHPDLTNIHPIVKQCWRQNPGMRPTPADLIFQLSLLLEFSDNPWNNFQNDSILVSILTWILSFVLCMKD